MSVSTEAAELKVGDRVLVNNWRKEVMRKLGEVKQVEPSGAVVSVKGQTLWLFHDELTLQIELAARTNISEYNFGVRSIKQNAQNWYSRASDETTTYSSRS